MNELQVKENDAFNYESIDKETADYLQILVGNMRRHVQKARYEIACELAKAHDKLAKNGYGCFYEWCESLGFKQHTVKQELNFFRLIGNNITNQNLIEGLPKSLQDDMSKKSAPAELTQKVLDGEITTHKQWQEEKKALLAKAEQAERDRDNAQERTNQVMADNDRLIQKVNAQAEELQDMKDNPQVVEVPTGITQEQLDREIKRRSEAEQLLNLEKSKPVPTPVDYEYLKRRNAELERDVAAYKAHEEGLTLQQKAAIDEEVAKYKNTASEEIQKSIRLGDLITAVFNLPKNMEVADFAESYIKQRRGDEEQAAAELKKLVIDIQTIHDELDKYFNNARKLQVVK